MKTSIFIIFIILSFSSFANSELIYEAQKKNIQLTDEDKSVLQIGEISTARYVIGGILGTYPLGLGIGHAIQNRWSDRGYIFTFGELGSLGVVLGGAISCLNDSKWKCSDFEEAIIVSGAIALVGFRIWEIVDVWAVPPMHNSDYRRIKNYIEKNPAPTQLKSYLEIRPNYDPRFGNSIGLRYVF